jgi:carboxymethylenebutenolidase
MIGELTLTADATPMQVAVALPDAGGPHPGVLVAHHRGGVDDFTRSVVARLSANGFAAAPNFFHRRPTGEGADVSVDLLTDAEILADIAEILADIDATFRHLDAMPEIRTGAVAILGHCLGGRTAFLGAAATGFFHAAVVLYGGKIFLPRGTRPAPFELARDIACPMLGLFGADDGNPSPADVARIDAELDRFGVRHAFHSYEGAGHAFQNFAAPDRYRAAAAEDAWTRLLAFLTAELTA